MNEVVPDTRGPLALVLEDALAWLGTEPIVEALLGLCICAAFGFALRRYIAGLAAGALCSGALLVVPAGGDSPSAFVAGALHLGGLLLFTLGITATTARRRMAVLAAAGACGALAVLFRTSTWFAQLGLIPWLLARARILGSGGAVSGVVPAFVLGAVVPLLLAVAISAAAGNGASGAAWIFQWHAALVPPAIVGIARWLIAFSFYWLTGYIIASPSAISWLGNVRHLNLDAISRALNERGLEVSLGVGALSWLAISPFPIEGFSVLLRVGGPWLALCAGLHIESILALRPRTGIATRSLDGEKVPEITPSRPGLPGPIRAILSLAGAGLGLLALSLTVLLAHNARLMQVASRLSPDEGYIAAFARAMIDGQWLPYVDAVSHRGPVLYYIAAIAQNTFGTSTWLGLRVTAALAVTVVTVSCFAVCAIASRWLSGGIAAAVFAYLLLVPNAQFAFAVNGEIVGASFIGAALVALVGAYRTSSSRSAISLVAAAGMLVALASLTKQTLVLALLPFLVHLWLRERRTGASARVAHAALLAGFAVPWMVVLSVYALAGELPAFWYWVVRYNQEIYMAPMREVGILQTLSDWFLKEADTEVTAYVVLATTLASIIAIAGAVRRRVLQKAVTALSFSRDGDSEPELDVTAALLVLVSLAGAVAPLRFFPYYFVAVAPWIALLVGLQIERLLQPAQPVPVHSAGAVGVAAIFGGLLLVVHSHRAGDLDTTIALTRQKSGPEDPVCKELDRVSSSGDPVFVWGFDGDVYVNCDRSPATKYVYTTMLAGVVPPRWYESRPSWAVPGALQEARLRLLEVKPKVVLENIEIFRGVLMITIPELADVLHDEYCPARAIVGFGRRPWHLYVRRDIGCDRLGELPMAHRSLLP